MSFEGILNLFQNPALGYVSVAFRDLWHSWLSLSENYFPTPAVSQGKNVLHPLLIFACFHFRERDMFLNLQSGFITGGLIYLMTQNIICYFLKLRTSFLFPFGLCIGIMFPTHDPLVPFFPLPSWTKPLIPSTLVAAPLKTKTFPSPATISCHMLLRRGWGLVVSVSTSSGRLEGTVLCRYP